MRKGLFSFGLVIVFFVLTASAQTTAFTYQGNIKAGGVPATGNYDMEFSLFDAVSGGAQIGSTLQRPAVAVAAGSFTVSLDFGSGAFPGADRFLDIAVRTAGGGAFTPLAPRQQVASAPYAIRSVRSLNTDQLGGVAAANYVQTNGSGAGLTNLNATSVNSGILAVGYGGTGVTQSGPTGNFLRSNSINWVSSPILAADIPAGSGNYLQNTTSQQTANFNVSGNGTVGGGLSANVVSAESQYILGGSTVIRSGPAGTSNLYIGASSGTGTFNGGNTYVGIGSGQNNGGYYNSILGYGAGLANTIESSFFGYRATAASNFANATAIGSYALVGQNNSMVLGSINGVNEATADTNVGIGTTTPASRLHVNGSVRVTNGAVYITNPNTVIITSPNGACWGITVNNAGALSTFSTACP